MIQAGLELLTLLPLPPEFGDYKHVPPHMALGTDYTWIQHRYGFDAGAQGEVLGGRVVEARRPGGRRLEGGRVGAQWVPLIFLLPRKW